MEYKVTPVLQIAYVLYCASVTTVYLSFFVIGSDQLHRVSLNYGGIPCTSEFFCWPLRSLTIRMRSQYTPIYYRKSPVPSKELYITLLAHTHNSVCHPTMSQLCAPAHRGLLTYYLLISLDLRTIPRTAHNGRVDKHEQRANNPSIVEKGTIPRVRLPDRPGGLCRRRLGGTLPVNY